MISTSLFFPNGTRYKQASVFTGEGVSLNVTALEEIGLPEMTGSNAWYNLCMNLAIGGLFAHCVCFWGPFVRNSYSNWRNRSFEDPHYQAMLKYKEAPQWWYLILLLLGFLAGVIACAKGETTLPVWSFVVALLLGMFITPFSAMLYGLMGSAVSTNQISKMVAGAINPGKPVANLYVCHIHPYCHIVIHSTLSSRCGVTMSSLRQSVWLRTLRSANISRFLRARCTSACSSIVNAPSYHHDRFLIQMWGTLIGMC